MKKRIVLMLLLGALMMVGSIFPVMGSDGSPPMSNVTMLMQSDHFSIDAVAVCDQTSLDVAYVYLGRISESDVNLEATNLVIATPIQGNRQSWQTIYNITASIYLTTSMGISTNNENNQQMNMTLRNSQEGAIWCPNIGYTLCG